MLEQVLPSYTKRLLSRFKLSDFPPGTYLAGGTAVALHIGHRRSADLDFFTPKEFQETQWEQRLHRVFGFQLLQRDWQTLVGILDGVKISLFGYFYPLIGEQEKLFQMPVASLPDLAAMKLDTILGRGTKRDYVDIYCMAQQFSLNEMLQFYDKKYGVLEQRMLLLQKALLYYEEADADEMPEMLSDLDWQDIKKLLTAQVRKLSP